MLYLIKSLRVSYEVLETVKLSSVGIPGYINELYVTFHVWKYVYLNEGHSFQILEPIDLFSVSVAGKDHIAVSIHLTRESSANFQKLLPSLDTLFSPNITVSERPYMTPKVVPFTFLTIT